MLLVDRGLRKPSTLGLVAYQTLSLVSYKACKGALAHIAPKAFLPNSSHSRRSRTRFIQGGCLLVFCFLSL